MTGPTDEPIFNEADASPMPEPRKRGTCPACGHDIRSARIASDGDGGVCFHCSALLICEAGTWRLPTYDEAEEWDADGRIKVLRAVSGTPLPGPEEPGTET